ncbi:MAG TPA: hypothetical protein VGH31_09585 [Acidimicrobiales bacterium]
MSVGLADHLNEPAHGQCHGQAGDPGRGDERIAVDRAGVNPHPVVGVSPAATAIRLASAITLMRDEAIATCCALALAEDELTRLGQLSSAAEVARTFQLVEGRLLVDQALASSGS